MTRTLLVTGGAGFIGSHFVAECAANGYHVIALDKLTYAGSRANLEGIPHTFINGDIADRPLVKKLLVEHRIEQVIHLAAESHVDRSVAGPEAFIDTNITGTFHLLEACRAYWQSLDRQAQEDFRFLHVSSDEVYGSLHAPEKFSEASALAPNSPYAASKAAGDCLARAWHRTYRLPVIVSHSTNNYGPRQHAEKLVPTVIRCALAGKAIPVYGDGKHVRDWIHVEDHCRGLRLALERGKPGETYDFGGNAEMDNLTLVGRICELLDKKRPRPSGRYAQQIALVADRPGHDRRYATDATKARRELGFENRWPLAEGMEKTVDWYLASHE